MQKFIISFSEEIYHYIVGKSSHFVELSFCVYHRTTDNNKHICFMLQCMVRTIHDRGSFLCTFYWIIHKLRGQVTNLVFINIPSKTMRGKYFQWQDWLVYNLSVLKYISIAKSVAKMVMANQRQISSKTLMANQRQKC